MVIFHCYVSLPEGIPFKEISTVYFVVFSNKQMYRIWMSVVYTVIYLRTLENGDEMGYMMGYGII